MRLQISKLYVTAPLYCLLLLTTHVQAQERKRIKMISMFEIYIGKDLQADTVTKKFTSFSYDSTIIDQVVITPESKFFGFPIDHRDSIVLKDKRTVFRQIYGKNRQPSYRMSFTYQLDTNSQVIEETDSVYKCYVPTEENSDIHKDLLETIHRTTYQYNFKKQLVKETQQSDILLEPAMTLIKYRYNFKGLLKKSTSKGAEFEVSRFRYNRLGLLKKTIVKGAVRGKALLFYDDKRRVIKKIENFSDGKETLMFTYNENGDIWRSEHVTSEGSFLKIALFEFY